MFWTMTFMKLSVLFKEKNTKSLVGVRAGALVEFV